MKLDEYVEKTLVDIANGVSKARQNAPVGIAPASVDGKFVASAQLVKFEISVVVSKDVEGGIKVFSIGSGGASVGSEQSNKITFEIPVYFQDKN